MKVVIITEGGENIGFGHITRCISLSQAFEERGINPEFIINGDKSISNLIKNKKHYIFNWLKEKEKISNLIKKTHIVIIDSYKAHYKFYKWLAETVELPVYIDDCKRLNFPRGLLVNGTIYAENINYPKIGNITYLLGARYAPLQKELRSIPPKNIKAHIKSIVVTFGGDDRRGVSPKILKFLNSEYPNLIKNVVVGKAFKNVKELEDLKTKRTNLVKNPDTRAMKDIMLKSDIAITAGGQTLYELARLGIPTIGISVAENQLKNVIGWKQTGFLEYIGRYNSKTLNERLKNAMEVLEGRNIRKNKSEIGRKYVDGNGSRRVVKGILSAYFKDKIFIREAASSDGIEVFNLSVEDEVRKNSFNPRKFSLKHHLKWFREKIKGKNCVFFIVEVLGKFTGQLRFNIVPDKNQASVNISLVKNMRGLGLSSLVLDRAIDRLLKHHKDINSIKAYVKKENTPSIRSFEKAHFKFLRNTVIKRNKAKVYVRRIGAGDV